MRRLIYLLAWFPLVAGCSSDPDEKDDDDAIADDDAFGDDDDAGDDDDDAGDDDDDAGDDDDDTCPYNEEPPVVSDSPLPAQNPAGLSESTYVDGFADEYLHDGTAYTKVGVREDWGGTLIFFGLSDGWPGMNGTNTIDANDTGREVQVAFYDPDRHMQNCAWDASCQTDLGDCPFSITYLGWNPVQGGNRCNNGSGIDSVVNANGELDIVTTPLHWNPNWEDQDCDSSGCDDPVLEWLESEVTVQQTIRFIRPLVVEIRYEVVNLSAMDHASTLQEMPTMYTANGEGGPDLWRLIDAGGTEVLIDWPAGGEDGFYYKNFTSPGPWVTMQDDNLTYGVGIFYENGLQEFQGWQLRSLPFNNVRAQFPFGIPSYGTVRARAYLLLGSSASVANEASWLETNLAPFGWMDAPAVGSDVSGSTTIHGWALDNRGVVSVEARVDGTTTVPLTYGTSRPDVCLVWPGYPGCDAVGFTGSHDFGPAQECPHLLEIIATDGDGNQRVIANTLVTSI